jgi:hypothetical protein
VVQQQQRPVSVRYISINNNMKQAVGLHHRYHCDGSSMKTQEQLVSVNTNITSSNTEVVTNEMTNKILQ